MAPPTIEEDPGFQEHVNRYLQFVTFSRAKIRRYGYFDEYKNENFMLSPKGFKIVYIYTTGPFLYVV